MRRLMSPVVLVFTFVLGLGFAYVSLRLTDSAVLRTFLFLPFLCIWLLPVFVWAAGREAQSRARQTFEIAAYLCMGWVNFLFFFTLVRDGAILISSMLNLSPLTSWLESHGGRAVIFLSSVVFAHNSWRTQKGPILREVEIAIPQLPSALEGLRIVQLSDLHVGRLIQRPYVEKTVAMVEHLKPDFIALTGDFMDGSVEKLAVHMEPLRRLLALSPCYYITGNHEYYSGAPAWIQYFQQMGFRCLLNSHQVFHKNGVDVLVAGVLDPAVKMVDPRARPDVAGALRTGPLAAQALGAPVPLKIMLAHTPKLAPQAAAAGFDLQLSGHTHGGQMMPWTWVTYWIHRPHLSGLSREGAMQVYVNPGTGFWGPPTRFGTKSEVTLLKLTQKQ